ncbi:MAG: hypothetical protein IT342_27485 [Candidatus Melainabacteria bacterium]|nr:hypothetical protein [Candidatus Melainabacteria bacterium]
MIPRTRRRNFLLISLSVSLGCLLMSAKSDAESSVDEIVQRTMLIQRFIRATGMTARIKDGVQQCKKELRRRSGLVAELSWADEHSLSPLEKEQKVAAAANFLDDRIMVLLGSGVDLERELEISCVMELDRQLTLSELQSLVAFVESPLGAKMERLNPSLNTACQNAIKPKFDAVQEELKRLKQEAEDEAANRGGAQQ